MDKVVDYPFDGKEFLEGAIVGRYGKEGMTYFTGEFTKQGAGIFHPYPRTEPTPFPAEYLDNCTHSVS